MAPARGAAATAGSTGSRSRSYGHLFDAFLSPATNKRDDNYGGSLENRMRFPMAVLQEIRRQAGSDFILGVRMVIDETDLDDGLKFDEGLEIARRFQDAGLIDFVNVIKGHIESDEAVSHVIPTMGTPAAPHLEMVKTGEGRAHRADPACGADRRRGDGAACGLQRLGRSHRHDPRAYGGPAYRRQGDARRGDAHPPLRRRRLLHRPALSRRRGACACTTPPRAASRPCRM